jgi:hypothetical protein
MHSAAKGGCLVVAGRHLDRPLFFGEACLSSRNEQTGGGHARNARALRRTVVRSAPSTRAASAFTARGRRETRVNSGRRCREKSVASG